MKTRKIISIMLVIAMVLMLASCGSAIAGGEDANGNTGNNTDGNTNGETENGTEGNTDSNTEGGEDGDTEGNTDANTGGDGEDGNNTGNNQSNLAGSAEDTLNQILEDLENAGVKMPMAMPPLAVTGDQSQYMIGLSEADFNRLVESAYSSQAAIATFAHQIIMIQAKDLSAAAEIKNLVTGKGGYDAMKWICVIPDSAVAIDSGVYVLIVASRNEVVDPVVEAFIAAAGNTGSAVRFFEHIDDGTGGVEMGGGMAPMLPIGKDD